MHVIVHRQAVQWIGSMQRGSWKTDLSAARRTEGSTQEVTALAAALPVNKLDREIASDTP